MTQILPCRNVAIQTKTKEKVEKLRGKDGKTKLLEKKAKLV